MSDVDVDTSELLALARELAAAGVKTEALSSKALDGIARQTEADMVDFAPHDTGELEESISTRKGRGWRNVGATARHAIFVEFGTVDTPPQPYANPAAAKAEAALYAEFARIGDPFTT